MDRTRQDGARSLSRPAKARRARGWTIDYRTLDDAGAAPGADDLADVLAARITRDAAKLDREQALIAGSALFDEVYYLAMNADVHASGIDPLRHFLEHPGWVFSRERLLDSVWGHDSDIEIRTVDVHIRRLRKALGDAYENLVQTVRGTGYRFSTKA